MMILENHPPRLYTKDVLEITGLSEEQWRIMRRSGRAPAPLWRGKGGQWVYRTIDIARLMGEDPSKEIEEQDPIMQGLKKLGNN